MKHFKVKQLELPSNIRLAKVEGVGVGKSNKHITLIDCCVNLLHKMKPCNFILKLGSCTLKYQTRVKGVGGSLVTNTLA
jgi:hypothetical protein